jgi:hypothetical protein
MTNFGKIIFYQSQNQIKCLANSPWATANLPNMKLGIFIQLINSGSSTGEMVLCANVICVNVEVRTTFLVVGIIREYKRGNDHCTIDLLFDWFGISFMTTYNFCFYLQNRLI